MTKGFIKKIAPLRFIADTQHLMDGFRQIYPVETVIYVRH